MRTEGRMKGRAGTTASADPGAADPGPRSRSVWFRDGLRFSCVKCGACCRDDDEESFVFLYEGEPRRMAKALGLDEGEFLRKYVAGVDGFATLRNSGKECILLSPGGTCSLYGARPLQCRAWPFWPEYIKKRSLWQSSVACKCPGAGRGRLHTASKITAILQHQHEARLMLIGPGPFI